MLADQRLERQFDINMQRRNREHARSYLYEDNRFENNFGAAAIREVEDLIRGVSNANQ